MEGQFRVSSAMCFYIVMAILNLRLVRRRFSMTLSELDRVYWLVTPDKHLLQLKNHGYTGGQN